MKTICIALALLSFCICSNAVASVDFIANKVCFGTYTTFVATSSYADSTVLYYKWDLNNDSIFSDATGKTISYLFADADTFLVRVRVTINDGTSYDMVTPKEVVVYPIPNANFHTENMCEGKIALFQSTSTLLYGIIKEYKWDFNNDGNVDHLDTISGNASMNFGQAASFITKLEIVSDKGCHAVTTKSTQVYHTPDAQFSVQNACLGENTNFINQSTLTGELMLYYLWDFGDGQQSTVTGNPTHTYNSNGPFNAKLITVSENNCKDTFSLSANVNPMPTLTLNYSGDTVFYEGGSIQINAMGSFDNVQWSNGETNPVITVTQGGMITATASTSDGCTVQKSVSVQVIHTNMPVIRNNILTPNGDGINDVFYIENLSQYQNCKIEIYNSFGDKVFWSDVNYNNNWDGRLNGSGDLLDAGAYYYYIQADNTTSKGCINILH